jgi:hypothetical protein
LSTGIILGLGLASIVIVFYIVLNFTSWQIEYNIRKSKKMEQPKKYHDWVYEADDTMNKGLKFVIYCTYAYGAYIFFDEMWEKFN